MARHHLARDLTGRWLVIPAAGLAATLLAYLAGALPTP